MSAAMMTPMTDSPAIPPAAIDMTEASEPGRRRVQNREMIPPMQTDADKEKGLSVAMPMAAGDGTNRPQRPRESPARITPMAKPMPPPSGASRGIEDNPPRTASAVAFHEKAEAAGMASVPRP